MKKDNGIIINFLIKNRRASPGRTQFQNKYNIISLNNNCFFY